MYQFCDPMHNWKSHDTMQKMHGNETISHKRNFIVFAIFYCNEEHNITDKMANLLLGYWDTM